MAMVDISKKPAVRREAIASGRIFLKESTLKTVREGKISKGDVFSAAEIAAVLAVKKTSLLIPHCHNILIDGINITFQQESTHILARCTVKTSAKTGVEMEAIVGVTTALTTIWDMVKYLEKDDFGQYRTTRMTDIIVEKKVKDGKAGK